jgi:hypothetical protein
MKRLLICLASMFIAFCLIGCSPGSNTTHYYYTDGSGTHGTGGTASSRVTLSGTAACPYQSAVFELSFHEDRDSNVRGTLTYPSGTLDLTGTYTVSDGSITVVYTDGSDSFELSGTYTPGSAFSGVINRHIGGEDSTCTISAQVQDSPGTVQNYLGTFGFGASETDGGTWNMSIQNGIAVGTYARNVTTVSGTFSGTVSGSTISVDNFYYNNGGVFWPVTGGATGVFTSFSSTVDGSWNWDDGIHAPESGHFIGTQQ